MIASKARSHEVRAGHRVIRRVARILALGFLMVPVPGTAQHVTGTAQEATGADSSFRAFLPSYEAALRSMLDGDGAAWRDLLSTEPGVTLFTPFGGLVTEPGPVAERYEQVAARFAPGPDRLELEYLAIGTAGDLAYFVALERSELRHAGSDSVESGFTRVTMVFRREAGAWRLRHRHMDHLGAPE